MGLRFDIKHDPRGMAIAARQERNSADIKGRAIKIWWDADSAIDGQQHLIK
jgi:hypothetical protein